MASVVPRLQTPGDPQVLVARWRGAHDSGERSRADQLFDRLYVSVRPILRRHVADVGATSVRGDMDELRGEAKRAFLVAAMEYDPSRGAKFVTFLRRRVRETLLAAVLRNRSVVVLPDSRAVRALLWHYAPLRRKCDDLLRGGTVHDPIEALRQALLLLCGLRTTRDTVYGMLASATDAVEREPPHPGGAPMEVMFAELDRALTRLPPADRELVEALYLRDAPPTQVDLAAQRGVSRETIRRHHQRVLATLSESLGVRR